MPRAFIFDLDGTLVESLPGIAAALNSALLTHRLPTHPEHAVRNFIGNGSWMLCRRGAPAQDEATINALESAFFAEYSTSWRAGTQPFPGIADLLGTLTEERVPLAVFSNKPHDFTAEIVSELFPHIPFVTVLGHQAGAPRKPDPTVALEISKAMNLPPSEIVFVGDSTVDYETAVHAGMHPLLVDWGYHDRSTLQQSGATVVSSADQIRPSLEAPHPNA